MNPATDALTHAHPMWAPTLTGDNLAPSSSLPFPWGAAPSTAAKMVVALTGIFYSMFNHLQPYFVKDNFNFTHAFNLFYYTR